MDVHMRGDIVIVRTFNNEPRVVRVWEILDKVVAICSEENYLALMKGKKGLSPIGFPKKDVFRYIANGSWRNDLEWWKHLMTYV
jgi:hypothetical protein